MKRSLLYALLAGGAALVVATPVTLLANRRLGWDAKHERFTLPNGWGITPVGKAVTLPGDMPGNIIVLDGGKQAIVNTCGFHDHSLSLVYLETGSLTRT